MTNLTSSTINATTASNNTVVNAVGDIWYVKTQTDGWLTFLLENGNRVSICDYTKLTYLREKDGRVYFQVKDISSEHNNKICSIKKVAFPGYFTQQAIIKQDITIGLKYSGASQGILSANGKAYLAELTSGNRIEIGTHNVMRPDAPHEWARGYNVAGNLVWFPLHVASEGGTTRGRYLHVGRASAGCISISDIDKWTELYEYLIKFRSTRDDKVICRVKVEV